MRAIGANNVSLQYISLLWSEEDPGAITRELKLLGHNELREAAKCCLDNKIFLYFCQRLEQLGYNGLPQDLEDTKKTLLRQFARMEKVLQDSLCIARDIGIEPLVIKTLRKFPYVGSDIDLLTAEEKDYYNYLEALKNKGYGVLSQGPKTATLEKKIAGGSFLVDLHNRVIYAGGVPYLKSIWQYNTINYIGNLKIPVLTPEAELVLMAGHSVYKEFHITLADFFHALDLITDSDLNTAMQIAGSEGIGPGMEIFLGTMCCIHNSLWGAPVKKVSELSGGVLVRPLLGKIKSDINSDLHMPYIYPVSVPLLGYIHKLYTRPLECLHGVPALFNKYALTHIFKYAKSSFRF